MMMRYLFLALLLGAPTPVFANDSTAGLGQGGLLLGRTDVISMDKEDLYISKKEVRVSYEFGNRTDQDFETIVAFPMPDVTATPDFMVNIPNPDSDNLFDFEAVVDGAPVQAQLEQRAFAVGVEVTDYLKSKGVPVNPLSPGVDAALGKLSAEDAADMQSRGMISVMDYDDGSGAKSEWSPRWTLKSTYWWKTRFPASKTVKVSHHYKPSYGSTAGISFYYDGRLQGERYDAYKQRFCFDSGFEQAFLKRAQKISETGSGALFENTLEYILETGGNWALGSIGEFHLTIEKDDPDTLLSFCSEGVTKTSPTRFELTAKDFYPERNLEVLFIEHYKEEGVSDQQ